MRDEFKKVKHLLQSGELNFLMEAHNGLSAKIVAEAGFRGIWASGLSISASMGVRDSNEASWTQILEVVEWMTDVVDIPVLLDGDTGFGNFNNVRRLVRKLEQRNVAGVCIEDKLFPKTNSFLQTDRQTLTGVSEFCGKIKAAKDTQRKEAFTVVARLESLIAGLGMDDALERAAAYCEAGADAILCHSKRSDATEIEEFMRRWDRQKPVIIVPTKYYSVPTAHFRDLGVSAVIWANHNLRASIAAMQHTTQEILKYQSVAQVEPSIATVDEVFRLQNTRELEQAESEYLNWRPMSRYTVL